jgi:hypothetical protein
MTMANPKAAVLIDEITARPAAILMIGSVFQQLRPIEGLNAVQTAENNSSELDRTAETISCLPEAAEIFIFGRKYSAGTIARPVCQAGFKFCPGTVQDRLGTGQNCRPQCRPLAELTGCRLIRRNR